MSEIGGYLEWEMPRHGTEIHNESSLVLKSGRSCLALLLRRERPRKVWVPYYICDGALEPFEAELATFEFYGLDSNFEIEGGLPELGDDERLLYVDYFGLKSNYALNLERIYQDKIWIDHVQAFFHVPDEKLAYHFNSARKFFGVPDGAYLYFPGSMEPPSPNRLGLSANRNYRLEHLTLRLEGKTQEGYKVFQENERLNGGEIAFISSLGREMLRRINYSATARVRRENFQRLHEALTNTNRIPARVLNLSSDAVPFCYPYLPKVPMERRYFWGRQIYVPALWKECASRIQEDYRWEKTLARELLPLPVDQRYEFSDMDRVLKVVEEYGQLR